MAATSRSDDDELRIATCLKGLFDDEIIQILQRIETSDVLDVEDEMTERYDKDELRSIRKKMFNLAKEKVINDVGDNTYESPLDDAKTDDLGDQSQAYIKCVSQWEAVNRRAKHTLASDTIHFLMFMSGRTTKFPTNLVSPASLDKVSLIEEPTSEELLIRLSNELDKSPGPVECNLVYRDACSERYSITLPLSDVSIPTTNQSDPCSTAYPPSLSSIDNSISCPVAPTDAINADALSETNPEHDSSADVDSATSSENEEDNTLSRLHESLQDDGSLNNNQCNNPGESRPIALGVSVHDSRTLDPPIRNDPAVRAQAAHATNDSPVTICVPLCDSDVGKYARTTSLIDLPIDKHRPIESPKAPYSRDSPPVSTNRCNVETPVKHRMTCPERDYSRIKPVLSNQIQTLPSPILFSEPPVVTSPVRSIDVPAVTPVEQGVEVKNDVPYIEPITDHVLTTYSSFPDTRTYSTDPPPCTLPPAHTPGCRGYCENCGFAILLWECYNSRNQHKESRTVQTSTDDLPEYIRMSDRQIKKEAREKPITRREFDEYVLRAERKMNGNTSRVDEIMGWKAMIQSHVDTLENSFVKSESLQIAQQKEICDRLETLRLMEVEKATNGNERTDTRGGARNTNAVQNQRTCPAPTIPYDSIWNIEPDNACKGALCSGYVTSGVEVNSSTPAPSRAVDRHEAMAGAKALARKGTMAPEPKPQRSQGVAFFTPRPTNSNSRPNPRGATSNASEHPDQSSKRASGPSGLRRSQGAPDKRVTQHAPVNRQSSPKQRADDRLVAGATQNPGANQARSNYDLSGLSNSWYDDDTDGSDDNITNGDGLVGVNGVNNPTAKQRTPSNLPGPTADGGVNGDCGGAKPLTKQRWDTNPYELPDPRIIQRREEQHQTRRNNNNVGELHGVDDECNDVSKESDKSFAEVAANMKWLPVLPKKRKRERSGMNPVPQLRGASTTSRMEIYVQGLDYSLCNSHAEFEEIVYAHCKAKGVTIVDACTIPKPRSRTEAGCKVTVRATDYEKLLNMSFWPEGTMVRKWVPKSRGGRRDQDGNGSPE